MAARKKSNLVKCPALSSPDNRHLDNPEMGESARYENLGTREIWQGYGRDTGYRTPWKLSKGKGLTLAKGKEIQ